jgi:HAD superfamily hydrolase (TIGR01509 family)
MQTIRSVVFDMDGVLIDAKEWHYEALNRALAHYGFTITRAEHVKTYDGLPTRQKLEMLSKERGLPRDLHATINRLKQDYTLELIETECRPVWHHQRALRSLKRDGYTLGLASNSIRRTIERMMALSQLDGYLDFMLSNEDVSQPKPSPEIYLAAARRAGVSPEQCVVVEDNHHGIEAATGAGANVLAVSGVEDVTYENIGEFIEQANARLQSAQGRRRAA